MATTVQITNNSNQSITASDNSSPQNVVVLPPFTGVATINITPAGPFAPVPTLTFTSILGAFIDFNVFTESTNTFTITNDADSDDVVVNYSNTNTETTTSQILEV